MLRFRQNPYNLEESGRLDLDVRIAYAREQVGRLEAPESWREFIGTLGAGPLAPGAEIQLRSGESSGGEVRVPASGVA